MCGRFSITLSTDTMARVFGAAPANALPYVPNFNVCPTNDVHAVISDEGRRSLVSMRWGFLPHWYETPTGGPLLINARSETIAEKPAFRTACRERRCILPATGFYEWTKDAAGNRQPWYIHRSDDAPIAFAGIWQSWSRGDISVRTCAIVTTSANTTMSRLHPRMPVTLTPDRYGLWLGEEGKGAARLMTAADADTFTFYRVGPKVNSNRASGEELLEAI